MEKIIIKGGKALFGDIKISGAKNAALPIIISALLTADEVELSNIPSLVDIKTLYKIFKTLGVTVEELPKGKVKIRADRISSLTAEYDLVKMMRASVLVLGPLLTRFSKCKVALPGGCAIGARPVNFHLDALQKMGAKIEIEDGYINASVQGRLQGAEITFPRISVGATENILMAATLAEGTTVINNAAAEPEVEDLARLLIKMGAKISGIGTNCLTVQGVERLYGATHMVIPDRIEAATYMIAAAITKGKITLHGVMPGHITAVIDIMRRMGVDITFHPLSHTITSDATSSHIVAANVATDVYPAFPTDVQAQIMALMLVAEGTSIITENVFENRFMHVPEMQRMNADISFINDTSVSIKGGRTLKGAPVMASDLRASAGLVLAALAAEGTTEIERVYHLDRGYERLEEKLTACGADIKRVDE